MKSKLSLLALAAFALFAQKPAPEQAGNRSKSRLVEVNVIVRDKNGPVTGLTQKDFTLFDKGKEQRIASFVASGNRPAEGEPLSANLYGNRAGPGSPPSGITMILLDSLNSSMPVNSYARQQILKILEEVKPGERVVLAVLGDRVHVLPNFRAAEGQAGMLDQWMRDNSLSADTNNIDQRLHGTANALVNIAADLRAFTGRKNLVWVAGLYPVQVDHYGAEGPPGFEDAVTNISARATSINAPVGDPTQIDRAVFQKAFNPAMEALNFAAVAVYSVDARGLVDMPAAQTATSSRGGSVRGSSTTMIPKGTDAIRILAEDSGGRASDSANDIAAALRRAIGDAAESYTLGFYPDAKSLDTHFHNLKVQVDRPGVELHYRQGYVALPEAGTPEKQRAAAIRDALGNPLAVDGIGLVGTYQKVDEPKPGTMRAAVVISAGDLELAQNGDQYTGELEVMFRAQAADGHDLGSFRQALALKLTQAQYDGVVKQGLSFNTTFDTTGDVVEVRAVVCDHPSGRLGSLIMPVK